MATADATEAAPRRGRFRAVLVNRDFRRILSASAMSEFGDWLYNVALLVFVFDVTGSSAWVAAATVIRLLPILLLSPFGGAIAERHPVKRVIVVSGIVRGTLMAGIALAASVDGSPVLVLALVALATTAGTVDLPALSKATPIYVAESHLASANALVLSVSSTALVLGPAVSGLLLLVGPTWVAFAINALTFFASAAVMRGLPDSPEETLADGAAAGQRQGVFAQIRDGFVVLRETSSALLLSATIPLLSGMYGASTVLYVLLAEDVYGAGESGLGWLYAALGLGGLLFTAPSARIADSKRPALGYGVLSLVAGVAMATFGLTESLVVALLLVLLHSMAFVGGSVVMETVLQRVLPITALGRVFGLIGSVAVLGMVVGAMLAPPLVAAVGVRVAVAVVGLVPVVVFVPLLPRFAAIDRETEERRAAIAPHLELLRRLDAFADASTSGLEVLASSGERITVPAGAVVIREGEEADFFYVAVEGDLSVTTGAGTSAEREINTLAAGDGFGEIGLLRSSPRTASVTATTATVLHRYPGSAFVAAVEADTVAGQAFERRARAALAVSHPDSADEIG